MRVKGAGERARSPCSTTQANHGRKISKKKTLNSEKENKVKKKKSRHRTTLPHSVVQYHRREASYRSCSGWEREFQACYRHREKIYKKEGRKAGRRVMLQIQRLLSDLLNYCRNVTSLSFFLGTVLAYGFEEKRWSSLTAD